MRNSRRQEIHLFSCHSRRIPPFAPCRRPEGRRRGPRARAWRSGSRAGVTRFRNGTARSRGRSCRAARRLRAARARRGSRRAGRPRRRPAGRGRSRPARRRPRSRLAVPIVEPRIVSCFHQIRCSAAGGFGPLVAPQTVTRPSRAATSSDVRPGRLADVLDDDVRAVAPGRLLHRRLHVAGRVVDRRRRRRAPRARSSFASLDEVTIVRAPSAFAIASAAVETPLPIPQSEAPTRPRAGRRASRASGTRSRRRAGRRPPPRSSARRGSGGRSSPAPRSARRSSRRRARRSTWIVPSARLDPGIDHDALARPRSR